MDESEATTVVTEKEKAKESWKEVWNRLVQEAESIGLKGYKQLQSHFRNTATGAARCEALISSIKAYKEGQKRADQQDAAVDPTHQQPEETTTMKSNLKKKKAPATKTKRAPVEKKEVTARSPLAERFGIRSGTNKDKLFSHLYENRNKTVLIVDCIKLVYGNKDMSNVAALKGIFFGINMAIDANRNNSKITNGKYELVYEGRGEEATVCLVHKPR